jgi:hypothetical protein
MERDLDRLDDLRRKSMSRGSVSISLAIPLLLACFACRADTKSSPDTNPVGKYTLVTVDEKALPCTVAHEGSPLVKSGVFMINADGTCSSTITFSTPAGGETVREVKATYTRDGSKLTMKWERAGTTVGNVKGESFTMDNEGNVFAYRK